MKLSTQSRALVALAARGALRASKSGMIVANRNGKLDDVTRAVAPLLLSGLLATVPAELGLARVEPTPRGRVALESI